MIQRPHSKQGGRNRRRGMLLLELVIGVAALAIIMTGTLVLLAGLTAQRETNNEYFRAAQHLANLAEEIDVAKSGTEQHITLGREVQNDLPGVELEIAIETIAFQDDENGNNRKARQITCTLTWPSGNAITHHTTSLTLWKPLVAENSAATEVPTR